MVRIILENVVNFDSTVCLKISGLKGRKYIDRFMYITSRIGDGYLYPVIGILLLAFDMQTAKIIIPAGLIAFGIEQMVYHLLKHKIKRPRPFEVFAEIKNKIKPPDKFSFPSGHTAAAFLIATLLSFFYIVLIVPLFIMALLIGFSRVYNGVHYPGDIFAGIILGVSSAKLGLIIIL